MLILPLRFIREEDKKTVGLNLYHLAKLGHLGLPVVESVVVIPPADQIEKALHIFLRPHVNIRDHLGNLKSEILKVPLPESLKNFEILENHGKPKMTLNVNVLWENLLEKWAMEIVSRVERGEKKILDLTPQLVIFSANFTALGTAYFDEIKLHAVIKTDQGKLSFAASQAIENIVIVGNKKLLIPQIYHWVIEDNKIKIIKVTPFTQSFPDTPSDVNPEPDIKSPLQSQKRHLKTATKIFLDHQTEVINEINSDGVLLNIKNLDINKLNSEIEKLSKLTNSPKFIFNPDISIRSVDSLEFARLFVFFKNKKKLDAQIVLPATFSIDEYLQQKRDFAANGIYSKGSLKVWKQFNNAGDFLNLESYLEAGFDGAFIDLNRIAKIVIGLEADEIVNNIKSDWLKALEKFFKEMGLSKIIKSGKQVLISGKLVQNQELLDYFIRSGVWGIALEHPVLSSFKDHVSFIEKQQVKKLAV